LINMQFSSLVAVAVAVVVAGLLKGQRLEPGVAAAVGLP
jgi:hypothetical protein